MRKAKKIMEAVEKDKVFNDFLTAVFTKMHY